MFRLLRKLGARVRKRQGTTELDQLAEEMGDSYVHGLALCFDREGRFQGVRRTQGQEGILYKFGNPRGNDYTLVSKTSSKTENVVPRLARNASKIVDWGDPDDDTIALIDRCRETVEGAEDEVVDAVLEAYPEDASTDERVFAYWALLDGDDIHPLCRSDTVEEFLASAVLDSYAERSSASVRMHEDGGVCSVCGSQDVAVYGNFSDIACYNVDKQGFITGGFSYDQTTRNFPICRSCILAVRGGRAYTEEHLDFYMAGVNYWLLPDADNEDVYRALLEAVEDSERQTLGSAAESLVADERGLLRYISDALEDEAGHARVTLNFFFYESSQGAWRITGEMRRVLPSRITELYRAKEAIEDRWDLPLSASEREDGYFFNLPRLQPFCGSFESQEDRKLLRYLEAIFQGDELRERTVVSDLVRGILSAHRNALGAGNPANARYRVRDAWAVYRFLDRIDALHHRNRGDPMTIEHSETNSYTAYIDQNSEFFTPEEKAAAFLTGCYVGQVLYAQHRENPNRETQPFTKKFVGRKLDREGLLQLYNEGKDKLNQYDRTEVVLDLEPVFAETWTQTGDNWTLSDEETTFAFNLGWTLSRKLATPDDDAETPTQEVPA